MGNRSILGEHKTMRQRRIGMARRNGRPFLRRSGYNRGMSLPISHRVTPASAGDLPEICQLLSASGLSGEGLDDFLDTTLISRSRGRIIGCAALEIYGASALLRSVAVDVGWQARGLGAELVEKAIRLAQSHQVNEMFLLTTTAADYFARHGFARCSRDDTPPPMQQSIEFTTLCPASAVCMRRPIEPPRPAVRTPRAHPEA
jgi:amino-acid N-acetyltransferase